MRDCCHFRLTAAAVKVRRWRAALLQEIAAAGSRTIESGSMSRHNHHTIPVLFSRSLIVG